MLITAGRNKIKRLKICFNIEWLVNAESSHLLTCISMTYHEFLVATYEEKLGACETTYISALELIQLILEFSQTISISTT